MTDTRCKQDSCVKQCVSLPWPIDVFCGILTWERLQFCLKYSWPGCPPLHSDTLETTINKWFSFRDHDYKCYTYYSFTGFLPVSAKAAKGKDSLSLLSDNSAMAMRPLICSIWLGRWLDWQIDRKTSPSRLQSSCFVQSCQSKTIK